MNLFETSTVKYFNLANNRPEKIWLVPISKRLHNDSGEMSRITSEKKRRKRQVHLCVFCKSTVQNFARHIINKHETEEEIKPIINLPAKHPQRILVLKKLRYKGMEVLNNKATSNEELIVPRGDTNEPRFPCPNCKLFLKRTSFYSHTKHCPAGFSKELCQTTERKNNALTNARKELHKQYGMVSTSKELLKLKTQPCPQLIEILSTMRIKKEHDLIISDPILIDYGNILCSRHRTESHLNNYIKQKLKYIIDIFFLIKNKHPQLKTPIEIFRPSLWEEFIEAVKERAGWDENSKRFKSPSTVTILGLEFNAFIKHLETYIVLNNKEELKDNIVKWKTIKEGRFFNEIGKSAYQEQKRKKWETRKLLPTTSDIKLLNTHLTQTIKNATNILRNKFCRNEWKRLNKAIMVEIMLFNRKRPGDVDKILLKDFETRRDIQKDTDIYNSLTPWEKTQVSKFQRMEVRGKQGKGVAVLLTIDQVDSIKSIIKWRKEANVIENNKYLFASEHKNFKASLAMSEIAYNCGAESPECLTGTKLRQHIASTVQALNMSENDLNLLAQFLGHSTNTHKEYYRLPNDISQLTVVATLLSVTNEGKIPHFRGKSVSEINEFLENANDPDVAINYFSSNIEERVPVVESVVSVPGPSTEISSDEESTCSEGELLLPTKKPRGVSKNPWTTPEKHLLREAFKSSLESPYKAPTTAEVARIKNDNNELKNRSVAQTKAYIYNEINRRKRRRLLDK